MIKHVQVKNFRSLNDVSLSLSSRNVLVGPNMSGKSNLISLFSFLRRMVLPTPGAHGLPSAINASGGFAELAWRGSDSNLLSISIGGEGDLAGTGTETKSVDWRYKLDVLGDRSRGSIMVQDEVLTLSTDARDIALISKDPNTGRRVLRSKAGAELARVDDSTRSALEYEIPDWEGNLLRIYFASFVFYRLIPELMKQTNPVSSPRFLDENGGNLSSWLMMIQTRFPDSFARIVSAVKDVLPDVTDIVTWPTAQSTVEVKSSERHLRSRVPVWQMSDGELVFIALVSLIFAPEEESGASLVCVEELETHLHPRLIDALIKLHNQRRQELGEKTAQVIITTHSPLVVDKVRLEDLIVVSKRDGQTLVTRPASQPELRSVLEDEEIGLGDLVYSGALGEE